MTGRMEGRCGIVTGGGSGIGAAIVARLAAEGARCLVLDVDEAGGRAVAAAHGADFRRGDVTEESDVASAVDHAADAYGRLDFMVNNAGIVGALGSITRIEAAQWRRTVDVLLHGVFHGVKHAGRVMAGQGHGSILNIASTAGVRAGLGPHAYTAAKHAVVGLTRSAAAELGTSGVRVNAIAPGATRTAILEGSGPLPGGPREDEFGTAEDMAATALHLLSEDSRWIRGAVLVVDGAHEDVGDRVLRWTSTAPSPAGGHGGGGES